MTTHAMQKRIDIGPVIDRASEAMRRNFAPFFGFSLLLAGLPGVAMQFLLVRDFENGELPFLSPAYWAIMVTAVFTGFLLQAILVRSAILSLDGRPPDYPASVALALRLLLPMAGLTIVTSLMIAVGMLLFVVPGIIAYIMVIVSVPAMIEERRGVIASINRSAQLTAGSRWRIFGLIAIVFVGWAVLAYVATAVVTPGSDFEQPTVPALAAEALVSSIMAMVMAALVAALYLELRAIKEGDDGGRLAEIFA